MPIRLTVSHKRTENNARNRAFPINPWIGATRGIEEKINSQWTGLKEEKINPGNILLGRQINYSFKQLVQYFFKIYDDHRELIYSKEWA
ncbi:MAG: hypothetical protein RBT06_05715 [Smithellaceae bacterium]|jgi:hypothetical protein|nr:hypothetical protein [Smithellaceae bacterium]